MRFETLKERMTNAQTKIEKKNTTILKKTALIEKKRAKLEKLGIDPNGDRYQHRDNNEAFWLFVDIKQLGEDIERLQKEIKETETTLKKYEAQLSGEIEKESILLKEIPESMKRMQTELVEKWDVWDVERRERLKEARRTMTYEEFWKKYNKSDYDFMYKTDEQIHNSNIQDAKMMILNLYYRVKDITGEITDWNNIYCTAGTWGCPVLNGYVVGKEGRAKVESIDAGGYNIQRLHIRVLVHAW